MKPIQARPYIANRRSLSFYLIVIAQRVIMCYYLGYVIGSCRAVIRRTSRQQSFGPDERRLHIVIRILPA